MNQWPRLSFWSPSWHDPTRNNSETWSVLNRISLKLIDICRSAWPLKHMTVADWGCHWRLNLVCSLRCPKQHFFRRVSRPEKNKVTLRARSMLTKHDGSLWDLASSGPQKLKDPYNTVETSIKNAKNCVPKMWHHQFYMFFFGHCTAKN